jgi:Ca2+-binding RTX toxin-like protein
VLTGGDDRDVFRFFDGDLATIRGAADRITDFDHALNERIRLDGVDANATLGGDQTVTSIGAGAFTGVAGQLHYAQSGGNTYIEGDTDGDGVADIVLRPDGLHALGASDFVL